MWFSKRETDNAASSQVTTKAVGDAAELVALAHLRLAGLQLTETNYRTPGRGGGEIDLIMKDADGTLVFIEVRQRASQSHGGLGAGDASAIEWLRSAFDA